MRRPDNRGDDFDKLKSYGHAKPFLDAIFMFVRVTFTSITLVVASVVSVISLFVIIHLTKADVGMLADYVPGGALEIYDINDKLICVFPSREKREVVPLDNVSRNLVFAVLSAEDHHFYEHHGISAEGVARAVVANISAGRPVQGGSTLTQQLVKNVYFEGEDRSLPLKLAETLVAAQIESRYSKEKILEIYLNQIYFGSGAYGCEQASLTYFGKPAAELTIGEAAFIAGIIKSPSALGDPSNRLKALQRQKVVIGKMQEYGFISQSEAWEARQQKLDFKKVENSKAAAQFVPKYPYYTDYVAQMVTTTDDYNKHKGLKVYTCLDPLAQEAAEESLRVNAARLPRGVDQAALASIRLNDGAVVAIVGGVGRYLENQWNSAVHAHTMGSAFKPFVYLTAFEQRILTPWSKISDAPITILDEGNEVWEPSNFDGTYLGFISVEQALAYSRNVCSIRVAQQTGIPSIIATAQRAGLSEKLSGTLSLALGSSGASPLSMASAYATIARGGMYIPPRIIRRVEDENGKLIVRSDPKPVRALDLDASEKLVVILTKVVRYGTGTRAKLSGVPAAGKTGTSNQSKDLWFVGFTPDLATAVWAGNSENKPVRGHNITGGTVAAPIWKTYHGNYYARHGKPSRLRLIVETDEKLDPLNVSEAIKFDSKQRSSSSAGNGANTGAGTGAGANSRR